MYQRHEYWHDAIVSSVGPEERHALMRCAGRDDAGQYIERAKDIAAAARNAPYFYAIELYRVRRENGISVQRACGDHHLCERLVAAA